MPLPILLVEPNALIRQTVALTAASLALGPVQQATSLQAGQRMMQEQNFSSVILPLHADGDEDGVELFAQLYALRAGATLSGENIPVYVTASACSREEVEQLLALRVQRVLIKPFKTRTLIDVLSEVAVVPAAGTERAAATGDSDDSVRAV